MIQVMKTIPILTIALSFSISSLCQTTLLNENVIVLGEKQFNHPISIEIRRDFISIDSCQFFDGKVFKQPFLLLIEEDFFYSLKDYSELTIFNKDCFLYNWHFFPDFVRTYIIPFMDTTTELYQRVCSTYPDWVTNPFKNIVNNRTKYDYGTFYSREVEHHNFLIVLMSAKIYNEHLSDLSGNESYFSESCEENGIYYKVAIPIPEK